MQSVVSSRLDRPVIRGFELDDATRRLLNEHFQLKMEADFVCVDGQVRAIPAELAGFIKAAIEAYNRGEAISLVPSKQTLSTQEAAERLNISRSTLLVC